MIVSYSRCSVIHPVGDHGHRNYFHQNQELAIRMERSTDFFRFNVRNNQLKNQLTASRRPTDLFRMILAN
ncbi:MAG: hypothetical protein P8179_18415 [Candidatus Thiodiazotropha sp.]